MFDKEKGRTFAMHVNRPRMGPRDGQGGTSPADLLLDRGAAAPRMDRPADGQASDSPPPDMGEGDNPGGGPEFFDPESADYKAFGWAGNKTLPSLIIILKNGTE